MDDRILADEIIKRINAMIQDPDIRADIGALISQRIQVSRSTADHSTIQVSEDGTMGALGLLNGVVGAIPSGAKEGWGYITAIFDDAGNLLEFCRTA